MLKITVAEKDTECTILLEGRLAGPWVDELEKTWVQIMRNDRGSEHTLIDLSGLTYICCQGRDLLGRLFEQGAELQADDVMNQFIVDAIKTSHPTEKLTSAPRG